MRIGQRVKIVADEWSLFGKIGRVLDETVSHGSTRCTVEVDGEVVILAKDEVDVLL